MADEQENIKIQFDTNAKETSGDVNKLAGSLDNVTEAQGGATKAGKSTVDGLENMGGAIGNTITAMKEMLKQMWAIVANPLGLIIVAIVGALALLFKAFTSTNNGADKMEQIMAGLGAVVDVLRDRFLVLAGAIGKLITGDFIGFFKDAKSSVNGLGEEMSKEAKNAMKYAEALQNVEDATRDLGVTRAKLDRDLAASKELITDETASYKDKKDAIDKVREAEGKQTAQELKNARLKFETLKARYSQSDSSDEDLQKKADALSAVYKLQEEQSNNLRSLNKLDKKADNEEQSRLKGIADENKARYKEVAAARKAANDKTLADQKAYNDKMAAPLKERLDAEQNLLRFNQDLNDKTEEEKLQRQKERSLQEIEILKQKGVDVTGILALNEEKYNTLEQELRAKRAKEKADKDKADKDKESAEKDKQAAKDLASDVALEQAKKEVRDAGISNIESGLQALKTIAGKNKAVQKGVLIAESAIGIAKIVQNTLVANAKALAAFPLTGGMPFIGINTVSGGLGIAANVAATAKGLSALGGGSAPTGSIGNSGSGGSAPPSIAFNNSSENQIGQSISKTTAEQPPIKVVVAESDISLAQNNVKVLVTKNTF